MMFSTGLTHPGSKTFISDPLTSKFGIFKLRIIDKIQLKIIDNSKKYCSDCMNPQSLPKIPHQNSFCKKYYDLNYQTK